MNTYFRVLSDDLAKEAWKARQNSYHRTLSADLCGQWRALPAEKRADPRRYNLVANEGRFSFKALEAFLTYARQHQGTGGWTAEQVRDASELDGVCAFNNPLGAFDYACYVPPPEVWSLAIVEFIGIEECVLPAEKDEGGVIVKLSQEVEFYNLRSFRDKFEMTVKPEILSLRRWLAEL